MSSESKYHFKRHDDREVFDRDAVNALLDLPVTQGQFDALVSFAYNCGVNNLKNSTLLRMVNRGDADDAGPQLLRWNKAGGEVLAGLTRRREAEKELYEAQA